MLVATYHLTDTERVHARRQWIDARPVVIGRAPDCHVVIDDPAVADHHLRISMRDHQILVENLVEDMTTLVEEGDAIRIGGTVVKVRLQAQPVVTTVPAPAVPMAPPDPPMPTRNPPPPSAPPLPRMRPRQLVLSDDPQEQQLLVALRTSPADADARMVYADWLEGRGFNAKASIVRLREHLDTFLYRNATKDEWRVIAARTPIDHCALENCPGAWDGLAPNGVTDYTRKCATCSNDVRYCVERNDVRTCGYLGAPIVFDASLDRVTAHGWYENYSASDRDDEEDDPDGYTIDAPPMFRR